MMNDEDLIQAHQLKKLVEHNNLVMVVSQGRMKSDDKSMGVTVREQPCCNPRSYNVTKPVNATEVYLLSLHDIF